MGKIITFANQKGGVGKTTTCINLSAFLALMDKRVLIVDMDPQGNATSGVGIEKTSNLKTMYNVIDGDCSIREAILPTQIQNLFIIPATVDLAGAEIDLVQMSGREKIVKNALARVLEEFDYVMIDCPPSLGLLTVNALTASTSIMIPIQCHFYALEGLSQLMKTLSIVKKKYNPNLSLDGVVVTMFDGRLNLSLQVLEEIKNYLPGKLFRTPVPRNVRLSEAPSYGMPIKYYDKHSKGALAYEEISKELIERL